VDLSIIPPAEIIQNEAEIDAPAQNRSSNLVLFPYLTVKLNIEKNSSAK